MVGFTRFHHFRIRRILFSVVACAAFAAADSVHAQQSAIASRRPDLPPTGDAQLTNPIDRLLGAYFKKHDIAWIDAVPDHVFLRRISLDLVGLLPTADEVEAFQADHRTDKRDLAIKRLLDNRQAYADHWMTFWNDALRNAYRGTGFIDDGRRQITGWLYQSLYDNKPYNRFVHELISPVDGSEGFIRGIVWRGVVNASQQREMQAAQNISQVFLGTNLKCASCHDSFINDWKLADAYALANVFAEQPLAIHHCNKPTGDTAATGFIFPELGKIPADANRADRIRRLAEIVTSDENGRFARTIVNRLWAELMGRGMIEPVDEMDQTPWSRDLLDWLAADLMHHEYNLKHTLHLICSSRAYQLPSVGAPPPDETEFTFRGPIVRRLSAEQFVDAVGRLTGTPFLTDGLMKKRDGRGQGGQVTAVSKTVFRDSIESLRIEPAAKWIWSHPEALRSDPGSRVYLRRQLTIDRVPESVTATVACDNQFILFVNGRKVVAAADWTAPSHAAIRQHLKPGTNTIAILAINYPDPEKNEELGPNPAGLYFEAVARNDDSVVWRIGSDAEWLVSEQKQAGWQKPDFTTKGWTHAAEIGEPNTAPWRLAERLATTADRLPESVRAALAINDPLMRALGRPNREQVVTRRDSWATTLQALELTNGGNLADRLKQGARHRIEMSAGSSERLVEQLYLEGLGRKPNTAERATALELIGHPADPEAVEDLLWVIVMLDEFQLVY